MELNPKIHKTPNPTDQAQQPKESLIVNTTKMAMWWKSAKKAKTKDVLSGHVGDHQGIHRIQKPGEDSSSGEMIANHVPSASEETSVRWLVRKKKDRIRESGFTAETRIDFATHARFSSGRTRWMSIYQSSPKSRRKKRRPRMNLNNHIIILYINRILKTKMVESEHQFPEEDISDLETRGVI